MDHEPGTSFALLDQEPEIARRARKNSEGAGGHFEFRTLVSPMTKPDTDWKIFLSEIPAGSE